MSTDLRDALHELHAIVGDDLTAADLRREAGGPDKRDI